MVRPGEKNSNWKGGLTKFRTADELLSLSKDVQDEVWRRLMAEWTEEAETGCWLWTGRVFKKSGRACLTLGGNNHTAARLVFVLVKGPLNDLCALHTCDNPLCVNYDHLFAGTNQDNSSDMVEKGRQATGNRNGSRLHPERLRRGDNHPARIRPELRQGEKNGRALLTESQVLEIRKRYRPYINCRKPSNGRELATEFKVAPHVIHAIGKGLTWKHLL